MNTEIWKPVPGFDGRIEASNFGRIRSKDKMKRIRDGRMAFHAGRIFKANPDRNGYPVVNVGLKSHALVHRLVALTFLPNPEGKPEVNHKNGVRNDNRLENLEWVTGSENTFHAFRVLRRRKVSQPGEAHHNARLNEELVKDIRVLCKHLSHEQVAGMFKVSRGQVSRIARGAAWRHVHV
jgi:predicted XRE-type DNA-binding protein